MLDTFAPLLLILGTGVAYRFLPDVPAADAVRKMIGAIVLNVFLPALTVTVLASAPLSSDLWTVPATSAACIIVSVAIAFGIYVGIPWYRNNVPRPMAGALLLGAAWCNATYLGLPITTALVGDHVRRVPILFDLLAMTPLLFTVGMAICQKFGTNADGTNPGNIVRRILVSPPLIAAVVGLALNIGGVSLPAIVTLACETMGKAVSPLMIFSVGLALRIPSVRHVHIILPAVAIKLVVAAFVGLSVAGMLIADPDVRLATVLESGMPTMMLTMIFAERYGLDTTILADTILITTLASLVTIPFLPGLL